MALDIEKYGFVINGKMFARGYVPEKNKIIDEIKKQRNQSSQN